MPTHDNAEDRPHLNDNLPPPLDILREDAEPMPPWLDQYNPGAPFPREAFFASRIVYYPGSRADGNPLEVFGKSHAAHCFVYCDNSISEQGVRNQLENENQMGHPSGYRQITGTHVCKHELTPQLVTLHYDLRPENVDRATREPHGGSFAYWAVLERTEEFDDRHGPKRLSILHVGAEGIATFDALFCQRGSNPPFAVVLQTMDMEATGPRLVAPTAFSLKFAQIIAVDFRNGFWWPTTPIHGQVMPRYPARRNDEAVPCFASRGEPHQEPTCC